MVVYGSVVIVFFVCIERGVNVFIILRWGGEADLFILFQGALTKFNGPIVVVGLFIANDNVVAVILHFINHDVRELDVAETTTIVIEGLHGANLPETLLLPYEYLVLVADAY